MSFKELSYTEISSYVKKYAKKPIKIVAVSKNHPINSIKQAISFGVKIFGENRVQEATLKFNQLRQSNPSLELHLTGPLQTNKVKSAIEIFDVFQTLDREKLANEFNKYKNLIEDKKFFIQVNIGSEENKSGIPIPSSDDFIHYCRDDLGLNIVGLMCIPPIGESPNKYFLKLKKIAEKNSLQELSMGMSGDYKEAIKCGASHIRVGTILFGQRAYDN